ncbi:hypothetical protein SAMN04487897_14014 [Paenibacillus sp. yr247]|nr:hypothetical protein SAMN04487897_14014 [Paenibacillus sp. yr247]
MKQRSWASGDSPNRLALQEATETGCIVTLKMGSFISKIYQGLFDIKEVVYCHVSMTLNYSFFPLFTIISLYNCS